MPNTKRAFNEPYAGDFLNKIAFPLGGIGAGMICLEGTGAFSHVSVRNAPAILNAPCILAAVYVGSPVRSARVLEGPVPSWKIFCPAGDSGNGRPVNHNSFPGLPRFEEAAFQARFPFATVELSHRAFPVRAILTGWSPFLPGNADDSSLPFAALEYVLQNASSEAVEGVFSFHMQHFLATETPGACVKAAPSGFLLHQPGSAEKPWDEGSLSVVVLDDDPRVDCGWFPPRYHKQAMILWKNVSEGRTPHNPPPPDGAASLGASIYLPFRIATGASRLVRLLVNWYVPTTNLRVGPDLEGGASCGPSCSTCSPAPEAPTAAGLATHRPWYSARFGDIGAVIEYSRSHYSRLRAASKKLSDCLCDTTLPPEVIEAVAANLTILKSPTVLRDPDGRLWGWEGCRDSRGCCAGSCTHVWNYAQALPHLFPGLERSLRQTEFHESQDERGHQNFRSSLPIRPTVHDGLAAADGQLGGIMKVYREWRVSGDSAWLCGIWPRVKRSLQYCIETWDPDRIGLVVEPHHNTYDIEFWGPDSMCSSFYLGALRAAAEMARFVGEDASPYESLYRSGRARIEGELFNGEYFFQRVRWKDLRASDPTGDPAGSGSFHVSREMLEILKEEGPTDQYGPGCLADGVLGAWLAAVCGLGSILDDGKVKSHLLAVVRHNLKEDLFEHANPQRAGYAMGHEGGLVLCTWPKGGRPSLPFPYCDEVWTGFEYQVAAHLARFGCVEEALRIVRIARSRHDGRVRNPFNEYECGHWYARAMSSYALLEAFTGVRYDAVEKTLYVEPRLPGDLRVFLSTATGYGTAGVKDDKPFLEVHEGKIDVADVCYTPFRGT
ncbi:MAG: GH116 family glycosyl hydrolase [Planctomycetota bacterium]